MLPDAALLLFLISHKQLLLAVYMSFLYKLLYKLPLRTVYVCLRFTALRLLYLSRYVDNFN